ncbi:hypothetical protein MTO96_007415 [Rhipicephalus appendiculatus]
MTLYPTSMLYRKVLDSLVAKYPHVIDEKYNRRRWSIALRSRFKSARKNLVVAAAAVKMQRTCGLETLLANADDEHAYAHTQLALASQRPSSGRLVWPGGQFSPGGGARRVRKHVCSRCRGPKFRNSEATASDSVELCVVSEPTECVERTEQLEDEESMDCPDYS